MEEKHKNNLQKILLKVDLSKELNDFIILSLSLFVAIVCWFVYFGWNADWALGSTEFVSLFITYLKSCASANNIGSHPYYVINWLGGHCIYPANGELIFAQFLLKLGFSVFDAANLTIIIVQGLFAFLCIRTCIDSYAYFFNKRIHLNYFEKISLLLIFAFIPALAWRITFGHVNILVGCLFFVTFLSTFFAQASNTKTLFLTVISIISYWSVFSYYTLQIVYYSLVFGIPVFLILLFLRKKPCSILLFIRTLIYPALVFFMGFALALPAFLEMLIYVKGPDASRTLDSQALFSFMTSLPGDWLDCLFFSEKSFFGAKAKYIHEANFPLGPFVLLTLIGFIKGDKRTKLISALVFLSVSIFILLTIDFKPVSSLFINFIPFMTTFRVAPRAFIVFNFLFLFFISLLCFKYFPKSYPQKKLAMISWTIAVLFFALTLTLEMWIIDLILTPIVIIILLSICLRKKYLVLTRSTFLLILLSSQLCAFKERLDIRYKRKQLVEYPQKAALVLKTVFKNQLNPLNRLHISKNFSLFGDKQIQPNSGCHINVSTLDGYSFPVIRFSKLFTMMLGETIENCMVFETRCLTEPDWLIMRQLYNVRFCVDFVNRTSSQVDTIGEAWAPSSLIVAKNLEKLTGILKKRSQNAKSFILQNLLLDASDPLVDCEELKRISAQNQDEKESIVFKSKIETSNISIILDKPIMNKRLLVLSMNYASNLNVIGRTTDRCEISLKTFPAYGALLGIVLEPGIDKFVVIPKSKVGDWSHYLKYLAATVIFIYVICCMFFHVKLDISRT